MSLEIIWQQQKVYKKFSGFMSDSEFISSIENIMGDERFDGLRHLISDFSSITGYELSKDIMFFYSAYLVGARYTNPFITITFVTPNQAFDQFLINSLEPELFQNFNVNFSIDVIQTNVGFRS